MSNSSVTKQSGAVPGAVCGAAQAQAVATLGRSPMWFVSMIQVLSCLALIVSQRYPVPVVTVDLASEISVEVVTDERAARPPRRPDDPLYICRASLRSAPPSEQPYGSDLRIVMFRGQSERTSAMIAPGVRAELCCSIDAAAPTIGVRLRVFSTATEEVLLSSASTFSLPAATSPELVAHRDESESRDGAEGLVPPGDATALQPRGSVRRPGPSTAAPAAAARPTR